MFSALPQPARGISATIDYTDTPIVEMRVVDTVSLAKPAVITSSPESVPGKVVSIDTQVDPVELPS